MIEVCNKKKIINKLRLMWIISWNKQINNQN